MIQPQCGIPSNGFTIPERVKQVRRHVLGIYSATIRGKRAVTVAIGEPIAVSGDKGPKNAVADLTEPLEAAVQGLLDELNDPAGRSAHEGRLSDSSRR
ncbi:MAG: hypothetical protein WD847_16440 [Pirellulales bacterium]